MNNIENIPSQVFDWIESQSYNELPAKKQQLVNEFLSPEEYEAMHEASGSIQTGLKSHAHNRKYDIKLHLQQRFENKHSRRNFILQASIKVWKVAALFILAITVVLLFYKNNNASNLSITNPTIDTLYITKTVAGVTTIIHDTVKVYKSLTSEELHPLPKHQDQVAQNLATIIKPDFNVVTIDNANKSDDYNKKNSMKDDTILSRFRFVSM